MSWEAAIDGGRTIAQSAWATRLRSLGAVLEHPPGFSMHHSGECLPAVLTITGDARFPDAARFARFGPIATMLQFEIERYGPLDRRVDRAAVLAELDRRIARLGELGAPASMIEHERERRASLLRSADDEPDRQRVYIQAPEGHLLVHTLAAAAYALACGGVLKPMDTPGTVEGDAVLGWAADRLASVQLSPPQAFHGWEADP